MSRSRHTFKQNDVTKALKATVKAGISVARIEIDTTGKITIVTGASDEATNGEKLEANEWDGVL